MNNYAIKVEQLSKAYQIGEIGTGTISRDLERWWAKVRGKEDPFLRVGEANDRSIKGTSNIVWSLKDIEFEIEQGDAVGIIGRNGAGKSTLLKVLSRVTSPTSGKITGRGRIASLLEVGTGFHPELTGRENIYLNGAILGMRKHEIKKHFDEIVDFAGIERYIDTPVKRYSSGMYVRLAFAVAAHLESEILIVDEVLAVGDAEFQKKCLGKMDEVSKGEGRTVLFVSHNMASIKSLCNKGMLLKNGQLNYQGTTNIAIEKYLNQSESPFFEALNHVCGNRSVEIIDILINKSNICHANIFEDIIIDIKYKLNMEGPIMTEFFILIYDSEENDVLSIFQRDSKNFTHITDSSGSITASFKNNLKPGTYKIAAGVYDEFRNFLDWVSPYAKLIIENNFHEGGPYDGRIGKVFFNAKWGKSVNKE